jgi:hypothetical protein
LYTIQGDPEAEYKVSDAQDFHGATFGEEVDEEPNVPQWLEKAAEPLPSPSKGGIEVPPEEPEKFIDETPGSEDHEVVGEEENQENDKQDNRNPEEEEDEGEHRLCPACGFKVDMGSSLCVVCGNTLS